MTPQQAARVAVVDRILAALRDEGPLNTAALRQLAGPYYSLTRVRHGLKRRGVWEPCPDCQCDISADGARHVGQWTRQILISLEHRGLVTRSPGPVANNGGDVWMLQPGPYHEGSTA